MWPSITCIKVRDGDKRVVNIKDGKEKELEVPSFTQLFFGICVALTHCFSPALI